MATKIESRQQKSIQCNRLKLSSRLILFIENCDDTINLSVQLSLKNRLYNRTIDSHELSEHVNFKSYNKWSIGINGHLSSIYPIQKLVMESIYASN